MTAKLFHLPDASVACYRDRLEMLCVDEFPTDLEDSFFLWADTSGISLHRRGDRHGIKVSLDDLRRRMSFDAPLARACDAVSRPRVLDLMAGLGRDGFTLGLLGCEIHMIERSLLVWALAHDCQARNQMPGVTVHLGDGWDWLQSSALRQHDVVYIDAMYPPGKRALPGKEMQYLRELGLDDPRATLTWLNQARNVAGKRVVLKRRPRDAILDKPVWQIKTSKVRFDVYLPFSRAEWCSETQD